MEAGDRIEADTLEAPLTAGVKVYIMNAVDKATRRARALLRTANDSTNAAKLLDRVCEELRPKRIQTDGGSGFRGRFEERSHKLGIIRHILPPRSPKLNGQVESSGAAIAGEFPDFRILSGDLYEPERPLKTFMCERNNIRPHKSLNCETPVGWRNKKAARI